MKVIIAGSRYITDPKFIHEAWRCAAFPATEVVSGGAKGVDALGEELAYKLGLPVKRFEADWRSYGKKAGILRNCEMACYGDALIAVWDGHSRGTKDMISQAIQRKLPVFVLFVEDGTVYRCTVDRK